MSLEYKIRPTLTNKLLTPLFEAVWGGASEDYEPVLAHSLTYVAAFEATRLVGFVNVAWDGGVHAFLLDTTVHPDVQRRGVGTQLVNQAVTEAKRLGMHWLHVDYDASLDSFYKGCGFKKSHAGLIRLN